LLEEVVYSEMIVDETDQKGCLPGHELFEKKAALGLVVVGSNGSSTIGGAGRRRNLLGSTR
jgi:hypothetical protein